MQPINDGSNESQTTTIISTTTRGSFEALIGAAASASAAAADQPEEASNERSWTEMLDVNILLTIVYLAIFLIGVIGNICNCLVIADSRNRYMKTATNYYLFSLSVSDLLLLTFGLPHDLVNLWHPSPYLFSEFVCISRGWISEASTYASVLVIVAFTVERYLAICHPLRAHTLSRLSRSIKIIVLIWLVASSCALLVVMQYGVIVITERRPNGQEIANAQCTTTSRNETIFELSVLIFFIIPMAMITILYVKLGYHLRKKAFIIKQNQLRKQHRLLTSLAMGSLSGDCASADSPAIGRKLESEANLSGAPNANANANTRANTNHYYTNTNNNNNNNNNNTNTNKSNSNTSPPPPTGGHSALEATATATATAAPATRALASPRPSQVSAANSFTSVAVSFLVPIPAEQSASNRHRTIRWFARLIGIRTWTKSPSATAARLVAAPSGEPNLSAKNCLRPANRHTYRPATGPADTLIDPVHPPARNGDEPGGGGPALVSPTREPRPPRAEPNGRRDWRPAGDTGRGPAGADSSDGEADNDDPSSSSPKSPAAARECVQEVNERNRFGPAEVAVGSEQGRANLSASCNRIPTETSSNDQLYGKHSSSRVQTDERPATKLIRLAMGEQADCLARGQYRNSADLGPALAGGRCEGAEQSVCGRRAAQSDEQLNGAEQEHLSGIVVGPANDRAIEGDDLLLSTSAANSRKSNPRPLIRGPQFRLAAQSQPHLVGRVEAPNSHSAQKFAHGSSQTLLSSGQTSASFLTGLASLVPTRQASNLDPQHKQAAAAQQQQQPSQTMALNSTVNTASMQSVIKMLVSVVVMFFICWAPFHAQRLMAVYVTEPTSEQEFIYSLLNHISGISYYISAVVNPILYRQYHISSANQRD